MPNMYERGKRMNFEWNEFYGKVPNGTEEERELMTEAFKLDFCELVVKSGLTYPEIMGSVKDCLKRMTFGGYIRFMD